MAAAGWTIEAVVEQSATVLTVDDERGPRESLRMILEPRHRVLGARDGVEALSILRSEPVDLVTLDLNLPGIRGEELMRTIRRDFPDVEVIIVTGYGTLENAAQAVRYGVSDYLQKPFDVVQVSGSVLRALARQRGRRRLVGFLRSLGELVGCDDQLRRVLARTEGDLRLKRRVGDLFHLFDTSEPDEDAGAARTLDFLEVLADTVERQVSFMRGHARRTALYADLLAERLGLSQEQREHVRIAAFLHDIGKIGVPTQLLIRPAPLAPAERALVERHPEIGARLVEPLGLATDIIGAIRNHHEWWNGSGYGDGLAGEHIPFTARIVGIADAYDAMTRSRPYRAALAPEAVVAEIKGNAGLQFDPTLAKEFFLILETSENDLQLLAESVCAEGRDGREAPTAS